MGKLKIEKSFILFLLSCAALFSKGEILTASLADHIKMANTPVSETPAMTAPPEPAMTPPPPPPPLKRGL